MLLRNFKSPADEIAKKQLAEELLKVEISNQEILSERIGKSKNPNAPPEVPPQYKSASEILSNTIELEKRIIDGLMSAFNFSYTEATSVLDGLSDEEKRQLAVGIPAIKQDIEVRKKFNPKLIDAMFFKNYLRQYFDDVAVSYGYAFGNAKSPDLEGVKSLGEIVPLQETVEYFRDKFSKTQERLGLETRDDYGEIMDILNRLTAVLLTELEASSFSNLNPVQKKQIIKMFNSIARQSKIPNTQAFIRYTSYFGDEKLKDERLQEAIMKLKETLSFLTIPMIYKIQKVVNEFLDMVGMPRVRYEMTEVEYPSPEELANLPMASLSSTSSSSSSSTEPQFTASLTDYRSGMERGTRKNRPSLSKETAKRISEFVESEHPAPVPVLTSETKEEIELEPQTQEQYINGVMEVLRKELSEKDNNGKKFTKDDLKAMYEDEEFVSVITTAGNDERGHPRPTGIQLSPIKSKDNKEEIIEKILEAVQLRIERQIELTGSYDFDASHRRIFNYTTSDNKSFGFGMTKAQKALKEHFKEDEKFLKETSKKIYNIAHSKLKKKYFSKNAEQKQDESSSDEEEDKKTMKMLKKHAKAEKPSEKKIDSVLRVEGSKSIGEDYVHRRIPVKKIIGKGVEVEEQPSYRSFGKYVVNMPYLNNKNQLKVKYPSLGAIPSIPPITVSDDYKDFINDVMDTGRANQRLYDRLPIHEQAHFEKVCRGAGLLEIFKLKRNGDDDEKQEIDRFNLLRGNYLGGNNGKDVVNELKSLTVKFINGGKITRREGLDMLMELSII